MTTHERVRSNPNALHGTVDAALGRNRTCSPTKARQLLTSLYCNYNQLTAFKRDNMRFTLRLMAQTKAIDEMMTDILRIDGSNLSQPPAQ